MEILEEKITPTEGGDQIRVESPEGTTRKDMALQLQSLSQMRTKSTYIKDVRTVFGKGRTEGYALIYGQDLCLD